MYISPPPPKDPIPFTSVPRTVQWDPPPFCTVNDSISLSGKSPQTSEFITKKLSGLPAKIWSRKWYSPPAVPRAVYSCKYLQDKYKYKKKIMSCKFQTGALLSFERSIWLHSVVKTKSEVTIGWDYKKIGLLSQQAWHNKDSSRL